MNNKTLGQFIAELRKEKGLTQRELSEMIGVSDKTVSHWERDESSPDISLLLTLSDIFGITVDELLKREKNAPFGDTVIYPQSENSMKENEEIKNSHNEETVEDRFRRYRLLSLIGTGFGVFALFSMFFSSSVLSWAMSYFTSFTYTQTVPLLSSLKHIIISLITTVAARIYFSHVFIPKEESDETPYIYKANRIFTLNIYLVLINIIFGIVPIFEAFIPYITLYLLAMLISVAVIFAIDEILKARGLLMAKNKKLIRLQLITVTVAAALILAGGGFWGFAELWSPTPKELVFDNIDEFVAYMETPCEKPEDAWRIDGVSASTLPPSSAPAQITGNTNQSPVQEIPETTKPAFYYASVLDPETGKAVTFKLLNGNVYRYYSSTEDKQYYVKTYDEELKPKNWSKFRDMLSYLVPFYCVVVIFLSFIVYMKKAKKLKKDN